MIAQINHFEKTQEQEVHLQNNKQALNSKYEKFEFVKRNKRKTV